MTQNNDLDQILAEQIATSAPKKPRGLQTARLLTSQQQPADMTPQENVKVANVRIPSGGNFPPNPKNPDRLGWCYPREFEYAGKRVGCVCMAEIYIRMSEDERSELEPFLLFSGPQADQLMRRAQRELNQQVDALREVGQALWASILSHPPLATWMANQDGATFTTFYRDRASQLDNVHPDSPTREGMYIAIAEALKARAEKIEAFKQECEGLDEESVAVLYNHRLEEISSVVPDFSQISLVSLGSLFRRDYNADRRRLTGGYKRR